MNEYTGEKWDNFCNFGINRYPHNMFGVFRCIIFYNFDYRRC